MAAHILEEQPGFRRPGYCRLAQSRKFYSGLSGEILAYARHVFGLSRRHEATGKTLRQWYEEIEQQTGIRAHQLDGPELPDAGLRIWGWYQDLDARRNWYIGMGVSAPAPISWESIDSYFRMIGYKPQPWQIRLLCDLDTLYRVTVSGEDSEQADSANGLVATVSGG
ncbi:phage tail assembly chaperone [Alcaligenes faecalis]|uniref:phage tail assembly chaperone n=1 Tax=Alcaligenes faecalis TaxID=511 RepID=UPI004039FD61